MCERNIRTLRGHPWCRSYISLAHAYVPVSGGGDEVEAAVHPVVWHQSAVDPGLGVQEVLALGVDVVDDRLPAAGGTEQNM